MIGDRNIRANSREGIMAPVAFLLFLLTIISTRNLVNGTEISRETLQNTLPAYAVAVEAETTLNSSTCARELRIFKDAIDNRTMWALKVLDASGNPKPGFIYGNNFWIGSQPQCLDATNERPFTLQQEFLRNASRFRIFEDEFAPFDLNYFAARFRHNSTLQYHFRVYTEDVVTLGLCLPASCTTEELSTILQHVLQERILMASHLYRMDLKLIDVRDLQDDHVWLLNGKYMIVGLALLLTICAMIAGTAYDVLVYQKYLKDAEQYSNVNFQNNHALDDLKNTEANPESPAPAMVKHPTIFGKILKCFSVYTNTKIVFDMKQGSNSILAIHGIRSLSMIWIILGHTAFFGIDFADNKAIFWRLSEGLEALLILNVPFSPDTFFFLSGFLLSYTYYKTNLKNNKQSDVNYKAKVREFFSSVIKRYLRLTPAYIMVIGIMQLNIGWYDKTSLFSLAENPKENCAKYWWRNLLYINTFFNRDELCLTWSWHVSNEMQYSVIGIFLVILSSMSVWNEASHTWRSSSRRIDAA